MSWQHLLSMLQRQKIKRAVTLLWHSSYGKWSHDISIFSGTAPSHFHKRCLLVKRCLAKMGEMLYIPGRYYSVLVQKNNYLLVATLKSFNWIFWVFETFPLHFWLFVMALIIMEFLLNNKNLTPQHIFLKLLWFCLFELCIILSDVHAWALLLDCRLLRTGTMC